MRIPRARARLAALAIFATGACAVPAVAEANFVYWTNDGGTTIGRAKLNGSGPNNSFIAGLNDPLGVAVDSRFIYWAQGTGAVELDRPRAPRRQPGLGRASSPPRRASTAPSASPSTRTSSTGSTRRATSAARCIDGTSPVDDFVVAPGTHCGVAIDANFVYWTDIVGRQQDRPGRDRRRRRRTRTSSPGSASDCGVASNGTNLYWGTKAPLTSIGRSAVSGASPTNAFISAASSAPSPCGVGLNSQYIFWGNIPGLAVGRANLSGSGKNPGRVPGATTPCLPVAAPSNKITFTSTTYNKKKGTAKISGKVSGPGQISIASTADGGGKTVKPIGLTLTASGPFSLPVKPKGKPAKALKKKGKAKLNVFVTYTPAGVAGSHEPRQADAEALQDEVEEEELSDGRTVELPPAPVPLLPCLLGLWSCPMPPILRLRHLFTSE